MRGWLSVPWFPQGRRHVSPRLSTYYQSHYKMAERLVSAIGGFTCYGSEVVSPVFRTRREAFNPYLEAQFGIEQKMRHPPNLAFSDDDSRFVLDPLMNGTLHLLRLYIGTKRG